MSMSMSMSMLLLLLSSTTNINKCSHRCFVQICLTSSKMRFHVCSVSIFSWVCFTYMMNKGHLSCLTNVSLAICLILFLTIKVFINIWMIPLNQIYVVFHIRTVICSHQPANSRRPPAWRETKTKCPHWRVCKIQIVNDEKCFCLVLIYKWKQWFEPWNIFIWSNDYIVHA